MKHEVIETDGRAIVLDLSIGATLCGEAIEGASVDKLSALIDRTMAESNTSFAFGRYAEPRGLYSNDNFATDDAEEMRTVHMGIDLFCVAGTTVFAPYDASVAIIANNASELDYGPLVILRHEDPQASTRYSLYGHLGPEILRQLQVGQHVAAGQAIATVGAPPGNGNWPPHLHFQLITDLKGLGADFPGVARASELHHWLSLSPSPAAYFPTVNAALLEYR